MNIEKGDTNNQVKMKFIMEYVLKTAGSGMLPESLVEEAINAWNKIKAEIDST